MIRQSLLLYVAILAAWFCLDKDAAWGVFALAVLIALGNLKRALWEVPGALSAILAALRGDKPEEESELKDAFEDHILRIDLDGRILVVRCTSDGWYVKTQGKPSQWAPRDKGAVIDFS